MEQPSRRQITTASEPQALLTTTPADQYSPRTRRIAERQSVASGSGSTSHQRPQTSNTASNAISSRAAIVNEPQQPSDSPESPGRQRRLQRQSIAGVATSDTTTKTDSQQPVLTKLQRRMTSEAIRGNLAAASQIEPEPPGPVPPAVDHSSLAGSAQPTESPQQGRRSTITRRPSIAGPGRRASVALPSDADGSLGGSEPDSNAIPQRHHIRRGSVAIQSSPLKAVVPIEDTPADDRPQPSSMQGIPRSRSAVHEQSEQGTPRLRRQSTHDAGTPLRATGDLPGSLDQEEPPSRQQSQQQVELPSAPIRRKSLMPSEVQQGARSGSTAVPLSSGLESQPAKLVGSAKLHLKLDTKNKKMDASFSSPLSARFGRAPILPTHSSIVAEELGGFAPSSPSTTTSFTTALPLPGIRSRSSTVEAPSHQHQQQHQQQHQHQHQHAQSTESELLQGRNTKSAVSEEVGGPKRQTLLVRRPTIREQPASTIQRFQRAVRAILRMLRTTKNTFKLRSISEWTFETRRSAGSERRDEGISRSATVSNRSSASMADAALKNDEQRIAKVIALLDIPPETRTYESIQLLEVLLSSLPSFMRFSQGIKRGIAEKCTRLRCAASKVIIRQGHRATAMFFILSGQVEEERVVLVGSKCIVRTTEIGAGGSFGDCGVFDGKECRTSTVVARTTVQLIQIDRDALRSILETESASMLGARLEVLQSISALRDAPKTTLVEILRHCKVLKIEAGSTILASRSPRSSLFIVLNGHCKATRQVPFRQLRNSVDPNTVRPYEPGITVIDPAEEYVLVQPIDLGDLTTSDCFPSLTISRSEFMELKSQNIISSKLEMLFQALLSHGPRQFEDAFMSSENSLMFRMPSNPTKIPDMQIPQAIEETMMAFDLDVVATDRVDCLQISKIDLVKIVEESTLLRLTDPQLEGIAGISIQELQERHMDRIADSLKLASREPHPPALDPSDPVSDPSVQRVLSPLEHTARPKTQAETANQDRNAMPSQLAETDAPDKVSE